MKKIPAKITICKKAIKKNGVPDANVYSMVEILNATVIISVIPALVIRILKSFIIARLLVPSNVGRSDIKKLIGKNMA